VPALEKLQPAIIHTASDYHDALIALNLVITGRSSGAESHPSRCAGLGVTHGDRSL
jgi:hypothetical protein